MADFLLDFVERWRGDGEGVREVWRNIVASPTSMNFRNKDDLFSKVSKVCESLFGYFYLRQHDFFLFTVSLVLVE